jgi:hypothetical protein
LSLTPNDVRVIRGIIAAIPGDVSNDAVGAYTATVDEIFAPATHAAALHPANPIVVGSRGAGKSFWSGVLGQEATRSAASKAYPRLGLEKVDVVFGFTGVGGPDGVSAETLNAHVPTDASASAASAFWWATVLRSAVGRTASSRQKFSQALEMASNLERREDLLSRCDSELSRQGRTLLVVYDALDLVATSWPRRRMLTETLLEVVWAMRAYRSLKMKLFLRPDQIDDDALRFVELPKLRTGAVRLSWSGPDLYGLLFARLVLAPDHDARAAFRKVLKVHRISSATRDEVLSRQWSLSHDATEQAKVMATFAGPYMASGTYGYKKGKTYDWPVTHIADAFDEVTPRSFLGLMVAASKHANSQEDLVITPEGIRHGLRAASRTRVDQLHQEFPWIKGVLAPLAGLLLPAEEKDVCRTWRQAKTIPALKADAAKYHYLLPFANEDKAAELDLFEALKKIGVMFQRKDTRIDMPDLFRVAAKLLKKGGTAPR